MLSLIAVIVFIISTCRLVSGQGTVNLQRLSNSTVCRNTTALFRCQTTGTGLLEWRDDFGNTFQFTTGANDPGATGSLGSGISLLLTEESGNTLTSTATIDEATSDILLFCFNGGMTGTEIINVAGRPSEPQNFRFNASSNLLQCDPPNDTPNCCTNYTVELFTQLGRRMKMPVGSGCKYNISHITTNTTFRVYCEDPSGRESASSRLLSVTFPPPPPPTSSSTSPLTSSPTGLYGGIGTLAGFFIIAAIIAIIMSSLFIRERCCKPPNDISMKEGIEMKNEQHI